MKLGIPGRGGRWFWTPLLPLITRGGDYDLFKTLNYAIKLQRYKVWTRNTWWAPLSSFPGGFFLKTNFFPFLLKQNVGFDCPELKENIILSTEENCKHENIWSKGKCCDHMKWKKSHFNIDIYPRSWTNEIKTHINWCEEKIKNNNNIKVLTSTIFDIVFGKTIIEPEHSFPLENLIKMGGRGVGCLCKWPTVQEKAHVTVWKQGWWGIN